MATVKKAQKGKTIKPTADSTLYFKNQEKSFRQLAKSEKGDNEVSKFNKRFFENEAGKSVSSQLRQYHKGKPGYDKDGFPIKKNKSGGVTKAKDGKWIQKTTASIKRRGTEGKCTPITKPGCTGKAKALAKTFKKIAKSRKNK
jgi:hypothetical protein